MNDTKFWADDPKLTAYALGELDPAEYPAVEAVLRDDAAARLIVEEIRALGAQLTGALAMETTAESVNAKTAGAAEPSHARAAIIAGRDFSELDGGPSDGHLSPLRKLVRFPQFYYVAAGFAAACFAVVVALRPPKPPPAPQQVYTRIDLSSLPAPAATEGAVDASAAAVAKEDQLVDATAPDTVAFTIAPPANISQVATMAPGLIVSRNLWLLGQAKDLEAKKINSVATFSVTIPPTRALGLKKEALSNLTARNEPLVNNGGVGAGTPMVSDISQVDPKKADGKELGRLRAQRASASQTYLADEKMLVDARSKAATQVAPTPASPSVFEQTAKSRAFNFVESLPLAGTSANTRSVTGGALAPNNRDGAIFSENQRLSGYAATDLDRVAPAEAARAPTRDDRYAEVRDNAFLSVAQNPLSTFALEVDTASYSNVRRFLRGHQRPPRDAVRIEELVNYFHYRYAPPEERDGGVASPASAAPFAASLEVADAPWAPTHRLVRIGLKGREVSAATRPAANLVFLLDVSGSMAAPNRLPLVKESMRLLVGKLRSDDRVAIVTYAGNSGLALESTPVSHAKEILAALDSLSAGGSTNGGMGIKLAYDIAKANFAPGGINRVILCTDGDFNVGVTDEGELTRLIEEKAKSGVALTALGFGMGNLKDAALGKLADHGNGNYGYIDSRREAEKILVEQVNGTLVTIAKDVKIQVEFNPARVASYRLLGYENRLLKKEDFNNDAIDAGEIGAGHTVTAFYEIVPVGVEDQSGASVPPVDELKYARVENKKSQIENQKFGDELLTVKLRYKEPAADVSQKVEFPLTDRGATFANATTDFKFAAAVASFGMILRESPHKGTATLADVVTWAESGTVDDAGGYRAEFVELAREAEKLER